VSNLSNLGTACIAEEINHRVHHEQGLAQVGFGPPVVRRLRGPAGFLASQSTPSPRRSRMVPVNGSLDEAHAAELTLRLAH
jgi:hypothetical protein